MFRLYLLCSLKTSSTQAKIFRASAATTADDARYRGPSVFSVREYLIVSTSEVVCNTSTPRDRYFRGGKAMVTSW